MKIAVRFERHLEVINKSNKHESNLPARILSSFSSILASILDTFSFISSIVRCICSILSGVGSILDKVAKDIEDTANLYLYLYLRYIFGQPVSYQYLKILNEAKDKISFCKLSGIPIVSIPG